MADMNWWKSPNYLAAEKKLQEEGIAQMERQERQAKRERNAALLSDIARVGAQVWAHDGGAWKIDKNTPAATAANSRLQEVRDRNAANMMLYAQRRHEAKQKDAEDARNKHKMQLSLEQQQLENELAQAKAAAAQQQQQFDNAMKLRNAAETMRHNEATEKNQREREARLWNQQSSGGGEKTAPIYALNADGTKTEYPVSEYGDLAIAAAYNKVVSEAPSFAVRLRDSQKKDKGVNKSPSKEEMLAAIAAYNNWRTSGSYDWRPGTGVWLPNAQEKNDAKPKQKKAYSKESNNKGKGY